MVIEQYRYKKRIDSSIYEEKFILLFYNRSLALFLRFYAAFKFGQWVKMG